MSLPDAEDWLRTVSPTTHARLLRQAVRVRLRRGAVLFHQDDPAKFVWVIQQGWVHLLRAPESGGRSVLVFTITPAEGICGMAGIATGVATVTAVAATACDALRVPLPVFLDALEQDAKLGAAVVRLCARRLASIARQYGALAEPVPQRLVRTLLRLQEQFGADIPMTHRELGQMAWTTTESTIRALRALKLRGLLSGGRCRVTLRDPAALARELTNHHGAGSLHDGNHRPVAPASPTLEASHELVNAATRATRRRRP